MGRKIRIYILGGIEIICKVVYITPDAEEHSIDLKVDKIEDIDSLVDFIGRLENNNCKITRMIRE